MSHIFYKSFAGSKLVLIISKSSKYSTSSILYLPSERSNTDQDYIFKNEDLHINDNIEKELKDLGYPKDVKTVDEIATKHLKQGDKAEAAYEKELEEDAREDIRKVLANKGNRTDEEVQNDISNINKESREAIIYHRQDHESEYKIVRDQLAHYKDTHCTEATPKGNSPVDYTIEKQQSELPDITESDGGE
jgi:uncharacterized protein YihD (DUF1040 family)